MTSNRLADEKSPYLLQHAHNPVNWFAWGKAAFQKAHDENKPIFLSIGYSTCHWCHVMERESFENEETAALMNEHFVNIKVDREERPDVDKLYMNFIMLANRGQGGWPMSVFLTPDLKPFYGGTYYPPTDAYGRPGFPNLLRSLNKAWREDHAKVLEAAGSSLQALRQYTEIESAPNSNNNWEALYHACNAQLRNSYDEEWAGFGAAPKFPRPVQHDFLHAFYALKGDETARLMSENTLRMMTDRGMNDQLGGGYHRYSVDQFWIVSHFEKMLYDQAQLTISLIEMYQISGDEYYKASADKCLSYVWRDMSHIDGGFYAAEDADSLARAKSLIKEEGAFYVWKKSEIEELLPQPDAQIFCDYYGVAPEGNAPREGDPHGEFKGKNILFENGELPVIAKMNGVTLREATEKLNLACEILFEARKSRPRPHRDDKIIVAWNGLMISAFARAAVAFGNNRYARAATGAAQFVLNELWDGENLKRHWKDGAAAIPAFCDDYAALSRACLDVYDATFETTWLHRAEQLAQNMSELFWDEQGGAFFNSSPDPHVLVRFKEDYDGAEPAASSLAVEVGARLFHILGRDDWREKAARTCAAFAPRLEQIPSAMPLLLRGQMLLDAPPQHIVICGERDESSALIEAARAGFHPFRAVITLDEANREFWSSRQPFMAEMKQIDGKPTAYVCQNFACQAPTTDAGELTRQLA